MGTQYDGIGQSYERLKREMPLARGPERATFEALTSEVEGRSVLDLACGTGWYSRTLARAGAASVLGVDISEEMVAAAERSEAREPLGIRYEVCDARLLDTVGRFDMVTAVWLLCYARNRLDLSAMAGAIYDNLARGGVYVGVEMNPRFDWSGPKATAYGLTHRPDAEFPGGKELTVTAHVDPPISFQACFWEEEPIVTALREAGFRSVEILPAVLTAEGEDAFWDDFRANPTIVGIRAIK
ncbi:class I SAM-dependent methyltransferase [Planomonospora sp. ID67723]|uniref:class I SAM-dependent methyltransferase n=1 Tax=Planomonospora sp. ID67723 TaxID=2738134 RepID=UPI0018C3DBBC|nr:class I SAM-dependent methyltransferase [Planomonospora sp. ID67723]MBG0830130.1 class I SAM-dependent methyltransferase [Planomonospora sp. ID67723]